MFTKIFPLITLLLVSCTSGNKVGFSKPVLPPPGGFPNIFKSYSDKKDSVMMPGWSRNFDMSGVSFNQRMTATLVTRRHVVMAGHYLRKPGDKVIFHDRQGKRLERTLVKTKRLKYDVGVGLLDRDVPATHRIYPLPVTREDFSGIIGRTAVITDQNRRLFFHEITRVNQYTTGFQHPKPTLHGHAKKLIAGDSGNPSFLISGNELVLIETHTFGGAGAGPFYGGAVIQKNLQAAIDEMAPGYRLKFKTL